MKFEFNWPSGFRGEGELKLGGVHANLYTSQLLTILYYKPWYQFNANT